MDNDELLRRHGLQVTAHRLAVLRAVSDPPHRTVEDIDKAVPAELGAISRQAVYDARGTLTEKARSGASSAADRLLAPSVAATSVSCDG